MLIVQYRYLAYVLRCRRNQHGHKEGLVQPNFTRMNNTVRSGRCCSLEKCCSYAAERRTVKIEAKAVYLKHRHRTPIYLTRSSQTIADFAGEVPVLCSAGRAAVPRAMTSSQGQLRGAVPLLFPASCDARAAVLEVVRPIRRLHSTAAFTRYRPAVGQ